MSPPKDFANLFLDMNAFFASVEQQVQPTLRGRPVAVAPYTGATGCVIAKSYEAKGFGVGTGTLVGEARKLCPQIIVLEARPELYLFYHRQIVKVLGDFSPFLQVLSVDEFNISLTGLDQDRNRAQKMAQKIKTAIKEKIGDYLTCSVGVGPNKWLAKIAGELKKPDGLVILTLEELPMLYRSLNLTDLPGINIGLAKQLKRKKIRTPFDFYQSPLFNLSRWFGHPGRVWFYRLRGFEADNSVSATKSIGHQHVLAPKYRFLNLARRIIAKMALKCAARLRAGKYAAGAVSVGIKFFEGPYWRNYTRTELLFDSAGIQRIVLKLFDKCRRREKPLMISITLFNLSRSPGEQISLFNTLEKAKRISRAIDQISEKFGPGAIFPASMFAVDDAAPERIPFGNPERLGY